MSPRLVALVAVVLAGAALVAVLAGGDDGYRVELRLRDAAGLKKNAQVRLQGVNVGGVERLEPDGDAALATLAIDDAAAPIGRDASARVRAANLLGGKYVDIDPGDLREPMPSGGTIPVGRTGAPVELDDLLAVMRPDTRMRLRILLHELGVALDGRGTDLNRLLAALPSSLDRTRALVDGFAADVAALRRLLGESDRLIASFARERASLGGFVDRLERALAATSDRHRELGATVRAAPATLAQLRRTLTELQTAARPLGPAASALRASAPSLTGLLRELPRIEPTAVAALRSARTTAPSLTRLADRTTPFVGRLRPTTRQLAQFAGALDGGAAVLDRGAADIVGALEGWARSIQTRDGAGHMFRGEAQINHELVSSLLQRYVREPKR